MRVLFTVFSLQLGKLEKQHKSGGNTEMLGPMVKLIKNTVARDTLWNLYVGLNCNGPSRNPGNTVPFLRSMES